MSNIEIPPNAIVGKNGLPVCDIGSCIRLYGITTVTNPNEYPYVSHDNRPTGVKYAMGFDPVSGRTRIAYVDYPKSLYTIEEIADGEEYIHILEHCNVCSAMDQAAQNSLQAARSFPASIDRSPRPYDPEFHAVSTQSVDRYSAGPAVATAAKALPNWLPKAIDLFSAFALRPTGALAVSLGTAMLADVLSGFAPPEYADACRKVSDDMADRISPDMIERVRYDAVDVIEAAQRDGDYVAAIKRGMFKSPKDMRRDLDSEKRSAQSFQSQQPIDSPARYAPSPNTSFNNRPVPRLFE
jgi:hypothetical protein